MFRRFLLGLAALLVVLAAAGCVSPEKPGGTAVPTVPGSGTGTLPYATLASANAGDYRIGPLDVLDVSVFQVPDLSKTVQVSAGGQITLPLIGAVQASGRTVGELEKDIAGKLGAKYLQSPQVSVFVKEYVSQRITVEGAVAKPGIYPTTGQTTLLQAVALAGGLTEVADAGGIVVFRTVGGKRQAAKFNISTIRAGTSEDPVVLGGDIIVVDQSGMQTALRNIRSAIPVFGLFSPLL